MSIAQGARPRLLLPRWRDFATSTKLGELNPISQRTVAADNSDDLENRRADWLEHEGFFTASDFVCAAAAHHTRDDDVIRAAQFLKSRTPNAILDRVCDTILDAAAPNSESMLINLADDSLRKNIARVKGRIRTYPRNPFYWSDLSHYYALMGQYKMAEKAMRTALKIAPNDRHILRSASRFLLLVGAGDEALQALRRSEATPSDPWLLSAEVSLSERLEVKSKFASTAKHAAESLDANPFHMSEMLGSLGTIELFHGSTKKAKALFKKSLVMPTENVVAQVLFHNQNLKLDIGSDSLHVPRSFEAQSRDHLTRGEFQAAYDSAIVWLRDQPFSTRAAIHGSYVASIAMQDDAKSRDLIVAVQGRLPYSFTMLNNRAASECILGNLEKAKEALHQVRVADLDARDRCVFMATCGLYEFRSGRPEQGRIYYQEALTRIKQLNEAHAHLIGLLYLTREEKRIGSPYWEKHLKTCEKLTENYKPAELMVLMQRVKEMPVVKPPEDPSPSASR